jgi:hypothetical protein
MPVTKLVERVANAAWNAVSSTPTTSTPSRRLVSFTRGRRCTRTAAIAVPHPIRACVPLADHSCPTEVLSCP